MLLVAQFISFPLAGLLAGLASAVQGLPLPVFLFSQFALTALAGHLVAAWPAGRVKDAWWGTFVPGVLSTWAIGPLILLSPDGIERASTGSAALDFVLGGVGYEAGMPVPARFWIWPAGVVLNCFAAATPVRSPES
jgi:hypothetical protein